MPEFILDHGTADASLIFRGLDVFTQAYIEAMFWTDTGSDNADEGLDQVSFAQLAPEALEKIKEECADFLAGLKKDTYGRTLLDLAEDYAPKGYDMSQAGHDFWLTRNHHGVGFWDRGLGEIGDVLTAIADHEGTRSIYRGDDGLIYYHVY